MCGLAGFIQPPSLHHGEHAKVVIQRMTAAITHRGPDSTGYWAEGAAGVVLGHRHLSILDFSPAGHQLMHSVCGRYLIASNGEILSAGAENRLLLVSGWKARRPAGRLVFLDCLHDVDNNVSHANRKRLQIPLLPDA